MHALPIMKKIVVRIDAELQDIVPLFLENRRADVVKLTSALNAGALAEVHFIAHNLAGTGAGYGFDEISQIGYAICDAIRTGQLDSLPSLISRLAEYLDAVEVIYEPPK
jgi:HPt (histidine-containing phosphotransfer) domain-containing protein